MGKEQSCCSRGQRASHGHQTSRLGGDREGRKTGRTLAEDGWLKGPLKKTLNSGWQSLRGWEGWVTSSSPCLPWPGKQEFY